MANDNTSGALQGRTPPANLEAERGVLGSIMLDATSAEADNRVLDLCLSKGITADSFYSPRNRTIFAALSALSATGMPVDCVTLNEKLRSTGQLEAAGGVSYIQSVLDDTPTSAHAEYYIDIVRQKSLLRKVIDCAAEIERKCYAAEGENADILLGEAEKSFLSLGGAAGSRINWDEAISRTFRSLERTFDRGADAFEGLSTGFRDLDKKIQGLKPSEMIVIAARPSVGKTSLAMNIAECCAMGQNIAGQPNRVDGGKRHPVLVFSLEMSTESLAKRMVLGRAGVDFFRMQQGLMDKRERAEASERLAVASDQLRQAPIYIDDTGGLDVMDMRARARRMKKQFGIELIVIDYLQLCGCREFQRQGRQIEVSQVSNNIKGMAKELKLPVIVLSQLSRANEQRGDKIAQPKLSDLRDSGAIEQDADVVFLLRRPCMTKSDPEFEKKNLAIVDVAKHRNGETGEVRMNFRRTGTRFGDRDYREDQDGGDANVAAAEPGPGELRNEDVF